MPRPLSSPSMQGSSQEIVVNKYEKLKNVVDAIQGIVVSAGIIIGGGWAVYTFDALEQAAKARAELEKTKEELKGRISLDLSIEATQIKSFESPQKGLVIRVKARNNGTRYLTLILDEKPVAVSRIAVGKDGELYPVEWYTARSHSILNPKEKLFDPLSEQGVQPGSTKNLTFYAEVKNPGAYLIQFHTPVSDVEERQIAGLKDNAVVKTTFWYADTIIDVR